MSEAVDETVSGTLNEMSGATAGVTIDERLSETTTRRWREWALVALIFVAALIVRFYRLHEFPPGLYWDEAANGVDALNVLDGQHAIYFPRNTGREPLFIYLQAMSIRIFGMSFYILRATAAFVGALTVPAIYWMVREAFVGLSGPKQARTLAAWTAAFVAFSYWHLTISRIGFRVGTMMLVMSIAFAFFWRSWWRLEQEKLLSWSNLILCGLFVGFSQYTYMAVRIVPLIFLIVPVVALLQKNRSRASRQQIIIAISSVTLMAFVVFLPLGIYLLSNLDIYSERIGGVSIWSEKYSDQSPWVLLMVSISKTLKGFVLSGDVNLRHNPANRPLLDWFLGTWLVAGLGLAIVRWRDYPYSFMLGVILIMSLPAILTGEGSPHTMRLSGILPAAYVLAIAAMLAAGTWLARRTSIASFLLLPLPFFLFSASTSLNDYFGAWERLDRFKGAFISGCAEFVDDFADYDPEERSEVWIIPLSPNYALTNNNRMMIDFLYQGLPHGVVLASEEEAPAHLAAIMQGVETGYLVQADFLEKFPEGPFLLGDPKDFFDFLLQKYGQLVGRIPNTGGCMTSIVYRLPHASDYQVHGEVIPRSDSFANIVTLTGVDYGRTAIGLDEPSDALASRMVPSGHSIWLYLRWQAETPIDRDLKARVLLRDKSGHMAGQTDKLLVSDRYPVIRVWEPGESASTYHIMEVAPATSPGLYDLVVSVYEDKTLQSYPVIDQEGQYVGTDLWLGEVEIAPPLPPYTVTVEPQYPVEQGIGLPPEFTTNADVALIGFDMPKATIGPGEVLPLALYWQAGSPSIGESAPVNQPVKPSGNPIASPEIRVALVDDESQVVAERSRLPADGPPISDMESGMVMRDWFDLAIPPTVPTGDYALVLRIAADVGSTGDPIMLAPIRVEGRSRQFELPPISQPVTAVYDGVVELQGVQGTDILPGKPGGEVSFDLVWKVLVPPDANLVRFVHILGEDNTPIAQQDTIPCAGTCPAPSWLQDEVLIDPATLQLLQDTAPGRYPIVVGWYDQGTLRRLPLIGTGEPTQATDVVVLPIEIEVTAP